VVTCAAVGIGVFLDTPLIPVGVGDTEAGVAFALGDAEMGR
jgi:hypothetical protein